MQRRALGILAGLVSTLAGLVLASSGCRATGMYGLIGTVAGGGAGMEDALGSAAQFNQPTGSAVEVEGVVYVADTHNHRIRAIAPDGRVTTIAGGGMSGTRGGGDRDGPGVDARFRFPRDLAADARGHLYVADTNNNRIRVIDLHDPAYHVTTLAGSVKGMVDGPGAVARFANPWGIAVGGPDPAHQALFVSDTFNSRVRRIDLRDPRHPVTTVAGASSIGREPAGFHDGMAGNAYFYFPRGIAADFHSAHPSLYVADSSNSVIRRIDLTHPGHAVVLTMGGASATERWATSRGLVYPTAVAFARPEGRPPRLYLVDSARNAVFVMGRDGGLTSVAGNGFEGTWDGMWPLGQFCSPSGVALDRQGALLVTDTGNNRIRRVI